MAQQDTIRLEPAIVSEFRIEQHSIGSKVQQLDSSLLQFKTTGDISSVLAELTPIYIKSHGPGNLTTTSFRGGSASHTLLVWNGFTINSPSNGLVDLSLVPVGLHDNISIQYGPSTTLWGSGAVGGTILLDSKANFGSGWKSDYSVTSSLFDNFRSINGNSHTLGFSYGNSRHFTSIRLWSRVNDNVYQYPIPFQEESSYEYNRNARVDNKGTLLNWFWRLTPRQSIDLHYWYQFVDRNIAPTIFEDNNNSRLTEGSHRLGIHYLMDLKGGALLNIRSAFFASDLLFTSDDLEDSPNKTRTFINEIEWSQSVDKKHFISLGLNENFNKSGSKNYAKILPQNGGDVTYRTQNRWAVFGAFKSLLLKNKLKGSISLRQEWLNGRTVPFTYNLGFDYQLLKPINLKINIARLFRTPNLNDLYWNPGGNSALLPEKGYSVEFTTSLNPSVPKNWNLKFNYTNYYKRVENWIQWTPGIIWTPQNLLEVESYGLETDFSSSYKTGHWTYQLSGKYAYTLAHNIKEGNILTDNIDKQLIYTPIYSAGVRFGIQYSTFMLQYSQQYIGFTFTSTDHEEFLPPYRPANIRFSYRKKISLHMALVWFSVNNLLNEGYAVVAARPMPLRNYTIGLTINLNQKQSR
jgi:iron complex outermembrane receptor protein